MTKEKQLEGWKRYTEYETPDNIASVATSFIIGEFNADRYLSLLTS